MNEQQQRDAERAERSAATALAQRMNLDIGAALVDSIVDNFWTAPVTGVSYRESRDPQGNLQMVPVPMHGTSPVVGVAHEIYAQYRDEIVAAVVARIDPDVLADTIAAKIAGTLSERAVAFSGDRLNPTQQQVHDLVREKLATTLSERAMARYDAEQAEAFAALEEKRQRDRDEADARRVDPGLQ